MNIVFCIYNFIPDKLPLQPWLTISHVARSLLASGHCVHIVTDNPKGKDVGDFSVHIVSSLRGSNSVEMRTLLKRLNPDRVVFLVTPLNLITSRWLDVLEGTQCYAFASYPFYTFRQLYTALKHVEFKEVSQYLRHALIPRRLWLRKLKRHFKGVICQSGSTQKHLEHLSEGSLHIHSVPPGIDKSDWPYRQVGSSGPSIFLYVGGAIRIRGFYNALDAMKKVRQENVEMHVLARGADANDIAMITVEIQTRGLEGKVRVIGGWLKREQLVEYIHQAAAVLLPFVLVPSELPVSIMEAIACGTPVITTDIDGLPSTVGNAGIVIPQGDIKALAEAMMEIDKNAPCAASCQSACYVQREAMQSWDQVGAAWSEILATDE